MQQRLSWGQFFGQIVDRRQVGDLTLSETRYAPGVQVPPHCHEQAYFCLVRRGQYTEQYGSRSRVCGPLTLAFHPPDEVHSERFDDMEVWSFNVEMKPTWLARMQNHVPLFDQAKDFHNSPLAGTALRLYQEFRQWDEFSALIVEGQVMEILGSAARAARRGSAQSAPRWLAQVREVLHDRLVCPPTLGELAALAGVHPVHLASAFRRHCHCSVGEYLRQQRVEFASRRLLTSKDTLAEIALAAGFFDQSHFSRTFKRVTGLTPAAFRQIGRRG
jgi:AraC family transcriptional regulator